MISTVWSRQRAGSDDANVIVRYPDDQSVFATPDLSAEFQSVEVLLADPTHAVDLLAVALRRPPITLRLDVGRLNGDRLDVDLVVPDEIAALILKNLATRVRHKVTDVVDVWRCLEIAFAAGVKASELIEGEPPRAADVVQHRTAALNLPASHWITGDTDLH